MYVSFAQVTVPNKIFSVGETVPFEITNVAGVFLKYICFFHDAYGSNSTTDGSVTLVNHTFPMEGQYLVGVFGYTTTNFNYPINILRTVLVTVRNTPSTMSIETNSTAAYESQSIHFDVKSLADPGIDTSKNSYQWNFGDGLNGTGVSIDHSYSNAGKYNVTSYATDETKDKIIYYGFLPPNFNYNREFQDIIRYLESLDSSYEFSICNKDLYQSTLSLYSLPNSNQYLEDKNCWNLSIYPIDMSITEKEKFSFQINEERSN